MKAQHHDAVERPSTTAAGRDRDQSPSKSARRAAAAASGLVLGVATMAGCSVSDREAILTPGASDSPPPYAAIELAYTGQVETLTVPPDVTRATLKLVGGTGSRGGQSYAAHPTALQQGAAGAVVSGDLQLHPGDVVTVAVGGAGGDANGNQSPGVGGWSLNDHYRGGNGGSGHGSQTTDGGAGGGASVIQVKGETMVVAGGGGGEGGLLSKGGLYNIGGNAGADSGEDGDESPLSSAAGKGGSSAHPGLDQKGHSYSGSALEGGGGGGGGGRYTGGGAQASNLGGGGGGGGSSLTSNLTSLSTGTRDAGGPGSVTITWKQ